MVGFVSYLALKDSIAWQLGIATGCGSVLAEPLAVITVSKVSSGRLKLLIGILTVVLGVLTLVRVWI